MRREAVEQMRGDSDRDGAITLCPHANCGFRCCEFQQGNYIVTYPGELEAASRRNESISHLEIIARYHGGYKTVCKARDTSSCDHGYKPLDCKSYPFFPAVAPGKDRIAVTLKGSKCPLIWNLIPWHQGWVKRAWQRLADQNPATIDWLRKVTLVGYETVSDHQTRELITEEEL